MNPSPSTGRASVELRWVVSARSAASKVARRAGARMSREMPHQVAVTGHNILKFNWLKGKFMKVHTKNTKLAIGLGMMLALTVNVLTANEVRGEIQMPDQWRVFVTLDRDDPVPDRETLEQIPESIEVNGRTIEGQFVVTDSGIFDFAPLFGEVKAGNTAYAFLEIEADTQRDVTLGMGGDWWLQAWLNGEQIVSTLEHGNDYWPPLYTDHTADVTLGPGANVLAVRFISGSGSSVLAIGGPEELAGTPARIYAGGAETPQGLDALLQRHGHKPYDLLYREGGILNHRIIFEDQDHGSEVWMLDNSPVTEHSGTASVWPAWNADASLLFTRGRRPFEDANRRPLFNADYSRLLEHTVGYRPIWDRQNPDIFFYRPSGGGALHEANARTGENRLLAEWEAYPRERSYGLTSDNRYVFVDTPNGGIWLPYDLPENPIPHIQMYDGRPGGLDADGNAVPPRDQIDDLMFRGSPRGKAVEEHDKFGPIIMVRTGMLIDRETGEIDYVIAPLAGEREYLRAFRDGNIHWPQGPEWDKYRIHKSDDLDELFEIYLYYPMLTHGHEAHSPDGRYMSRDGTSTALIDVREGEVIDTIRLSADGTNYHVNWVKHPRFYIGWVRGWHFRRFTKPEHANIVYQIYTDGTAQPVFNTHHQFNGYYAGGDFSMQSPDATKIHTASNMTGRFRTYVAVMARPRPPRELDWQTDGDAVLLSWEPSEYSRETRGYLVYRSQRSGDGYELLTPEPVDGTCWRDESIQAGETYYYVVSALEHSGLESGYSMEAARAGIDLPSVIDEPVTVYVEAEEALWDLYTTDKPGLATGRDVRDASDWYYIYRHPDAERGEASLRARVPADGRYQLWARVRSDDTSEARWALQIQGDTLEVSTDSDRWMWVHVGEVELAAGNVTLNLATEDRGAGLDLICLSSDSTFEPQGLRPEHATPPAAPTSLEVQSVRSRTHHLTWQESDDPAVSHYQVYAATQPFDELSQQQLIGSPTEAELFDWGLRADTPYYYAVTAVDRQRNQSEPVFAEARTPRREVDEFEIELSFVDAELEGSFERSEAGGLRSEAFVVPQEPKQNSATWQIDVPNDGDYYLWLRYLQRGDGERGEGAQQRIHVLLNGDRITTLVDQADVDVADEMLSPGEPLAEQAWTWAWPGESNLVSLELPAGEHTLSLENLHEEVRYDVLLLTNEPAFRPLDGRINSR
ncbi:fibronectin type III domain-containing protein [Phycisphaerales bacterium AB-hyl4]|uniref:Fibronectin type III domain-containing protein n=1 Tax=Natronomicrosphaera hydrolytica TaxID=3242702 RepID=A0ABV4UAG5_9BACT